MSFNIGDEVFCNKLGVHGTISSITEDYDYPIVVKLSDGNFAQYTAEGKYVTSNTKVALKIIKTATTIEPVKTYKISQIDKLGHIIELDDGTKFYQSHSGSILPLNSIKF